MKRWVDCNVFYPKAIAAHISFNKRANFAIAAEQIKPVVRERGLIICGHRQRFTS